VLAFGGEGRGSDEDLRFHFEAVANLYSEEKAVIKELVEGMLLRHDAKCWTHSSAA
jgi:hypothetical protein